jgi:type IV secretory pathway VirB2 component (pilin)
MVFGWIFVSSPAQGIELDLINDATQVNSFQGFKVDNVANDPRILVQRFINVVMGFLGMLAILIILFAGFKWMTAGGNKEQLDSAHKLLINGIIGLIIIFTSWTVAWFVVNTLRMNVRAGG